jgi:hypothetical protein
MPFRKVFSSLLLTAFFPHVSNPAGVTLITHGLNGNIDDWVAAMALSIPAHLGFPGTNYSRYEMVVSYSDGFYLTTTRVGGSRPALTDSGEIIIELDWSQLANGSSFDTYEIAYATAFGLLATNLLTELNGHSLAELPIHLIGHSRGGSLVSELSRILGTNGLWVDHLTTLDPHPLNNDGFNDPFPVVDAPAQTYLNVLYHDNYWQNLNFFVYGEPVAGAYVRKLTSLGGGYSGLTASHSDVHLWYHGTIDWLTPTSDGAASLTSSERSSWWSSYENSGHVAGFSYSLIGNSDRLSPTQPLGAGYPRISDGFNQWWDLGVGVLSNRTSLPVNSGDWPNLVRVNRTTTNSTISGQSFPLQIYYQWAQPTSSICTLTFYLDADKNPLNDNQRMLQEIPLPGTSASGLFSFITNVTLAATNVAPGSYACLAKISAGQRTRYFYAPESINVLPSVSPPNLDLTLLSQSQFGIGISGTPGQTIVLQYSSTLQNWLPLATNSLNSNRWVYTNNPPIGTDQQFYRALLQ